MSDDTKHPDQHHIPTPAEVRASTSTVLVPAHPDDEVRRNPMAPRRARGSDRVRPWIGRCADTTVARISGR